jgi:hypothetical protein
VVIPGSAALAAAVPNPLTYVLAAMPIGSRQFGLAILMRGPHAARMELRRGHLEVMRLAADMPDAEDRRAGSSATRGARAKARALRRTGRPRDPDRRTRTAVLGGRSSCKA